MKTLAALSLLVSLAALALASIALLVLLGPAKDDQAAVGRALASLSARTTTGLNPSELSGLHGDLVTEINLLPSGSLSQEAVEKLKKLSNSISVLGDIWTGDRIWECERSGGGNDAYINMNDQSCVIALDQALGDFGMTYDDKKTLEENIHNKSSIIRQLLGQIAAEADDTKASLHPNSPSLMKRLADLVGKALQAV